MRSVVIYCTVGDYSIVFVPPPFQAQKPQTNHLLHTLGEAIVPRRDSGPPNNITKGYRSGKTKTSFQKKILPLCKV